jgi:hypothetical protein
MRAPSEVASRTWLAGRHMFIWRLAPVLTAELGVDRFVEKALAEAFARHAHVNVPQVYYGGSPSVASRLERAIKANSMLTLPFIPVGAGWVGDAGGCATASACAERAATFVALVREKGLGGYAFWHWAGAPLELWETLVKTPESAEASPR